LQRHDDRKDQMIFVAQHLETSALEFFLVQMVGFHKDMLVLFSQELFTCSVSRVSGCKFITTELCVRIWSL
jgi:hypothetical protein